ncbi:hypothetical protein N7476_004976, partial [Penicillium atrosanguineum]
MAIPSNTIVIADDEELPRLEPGRLRPQRASRRDYSYQDFESIIIESVNAEADTTPSRKRRGTETKEPSALDNAFGGLRKALDREIQLLQEKNRMLRDEIRLEREGHQKTQEELSQQRERRILGCSVCFLQPDRWVTILCGHIV